MKKSGLKGGQKERKKQARLAKAKAKRKTKNGKATLAVVPDAPDLPVLPDRRAMEGFMAGMFGGGSRASGGVDDAQQLMYDAWDSDNAKERVALAREALEVSPDCADAYNLNPNDNQGLRYVLAACLLDLGRDEDTAALLEQYDGDCAAAWAYAAALLAFRAEGDSSRSKGKLAEAVKANAYAPAYLTGAKKMPKYLPDYIGIGDDNEAVSVASDYASAWHSTPGALEWLRANSGQPVGASAGQRRGRGRSPGTARE